LASVFYKPLQRIFAKRHFEIERKNNFPQLSSGLRSFSTDNKCVSISTVQLLANNPITRCHAVQQTSKTQRTSLAHKPQVQLNIRHKAEVLNVLARFTLGL